MVGAKLRLEAIFGTALRGSHDAGVVDKNVEAVELSQEVCCAFADAGERIEIKLEEMRAVALGEIAKG